MNKKIKVFSVIFFNFYSAFSLSMEDMRYKGEELKQKHTSIVLPDIVPSLRTLSAQTIALKLPRIKQGDYSQPLPAELKHCVAKEVIKKHPMRKALLECHTNSVKCVQEISHQPSINSLQFFCKRKFITTSDDGKIILWKVGNNEPIKTDQTDPISFALIINRWGKFILCSADNTMKVYDYFYPQFLVNTKKQSALKVDFSTKFHAAIANPNEITFRSLDDMKEFKLRFNEAILSDIKFVNSKKLIVTFLDGNINWFDIEGIKENKNYSIKLSNSLERHSHCLAFNKKNKMLATACKTNILVINAKKLEATDRCCTINHDAPVNCINFNDTLGILGIGDADGTITLMDVQPEREEYFLLQTIPHAHANGVKQCAFNASGSLMVTSGADDTIKLWDLSSIKKMYRFLKKEIMLTHVALFDSCHSNKKLAHQLTSEQLKTFPAEMQEIIQKKPATLAEQLMELFNTIDY